MSTAKAIKKPSIIPQVSDWGVEAHGGILHTQSPFKPSKDQPYVIDIENNQDGSCAGIGITTNGRDIHFYSDLPKDFFKGAKLVGHNVKYDVQMLRRWGFNVSADQIIWDTQVAQYVRDSTSGIYGLKDVVKAKYGATYPSYKELCGTGKKAVSIGTLPLDILANYNGCDVLFTYKLYQSQLLEMTVGDVHYMDTIELPTLRVLLEMEERGVQIDTSHIRSLDSRFTTEIECVASGIRNLSETEINLNSHQQIRRYILEQTGLALTSTAAEELANHGDIPCIQNILRYRQLSKLKGTYTEGLIERSQGTATYRLHCRFNQTVTQTSRLSSSDPNLQNIPTRTEEGDEIRGGFAVKEGFKWACGDYSQIEPRLMAHFSQDQQLLKIFHEGKDLYDGVTEALGLSVTPENRKLSKTLWLAIAYNAGAFKISKTAKISFNDAQDFLNKMKKRFSTLFYWKDRLIAQASIDGYVETIHGRRIKLSQELSHLAPNYKTQGSAAEIMKLALIRTRQFNPVLTVHDEANYEIKNGSDAAEIKTLMEGVIKLSVPLLVDMGTGMTWREAKS